MRPLRRLDAAPPAPDRTHLHLEQLQAVADRYACDHGPCIATRDQAAARMADFLAECGVDLEDPVQLHAALAGLPVLALNGPSTLAMPIGAGPMVAQHVAALAARTPALPEEVVR